MIINDRQIYDFFPKSFTHIQHRIHFGLRDQVNGEWQAAVERMGFKVVDAVHTMRHNPVFSFRNGGVTAAAFWAARHEGGIEKRGRFIITRKGIAEKLDVHGGTAHRIEVVRGNNAQLSGQGYRLRRFPAGKQAKKPPDK